MKKAAYYYFALVLVAALGLSACAQTPAAPTAAPTAAKTTAAPAPTAAAPAPTAAGTTAAAPTKPAAPTAAPAAALPKDIVIGTNPVGSSFNAFGVAFADTISKHAGMTGKVQAVSGAAAYLPMMFQTKEVDLAVLNAIDSMLAYQLKDPAYEKLGKGKGGFDLRVLTGGPMFKSALFVRTDSSIKTMNDVKGKKVTHGFGGATFSQLFLTAALASGNITWKDVTAVERSSVYGTWVEDFVENKADMQLASLGSAVTVEADAKVGIRALNLDKSPEAVKRATDILPVTFTPVSKGEYAGVKEDITGVGYPVYLVGTSMVRDDVAYAVVKAMWDNYTEYAAKHPDLKKWTPDVFVDPAFTVPYHPGAIKFYKEKGKWTAAMDTLQSKLLTELVK